MRGRAEHDATRVVPPGRLVRAHHARPEVHVVAVGVPVVELQADVHAHRLDVGEAAVGRALDADAHGARGRVLRRAEDRHVAGEDRTRPAALHVQAPRPHAVDAHLVDERVGALTAVRDADAAFAARAHDVEVLDVDRAVAAELDHAPRPVRADDVRDEPRARRVHLRDARVALAADGVLEDERVRHLVDARREEQRPLRRVRVHDRAHVRRAVVLRAQRHHVQHLRARQCGTQATNQQKGRNFQFFHHFS